MFGREPVLWLGLIRAIVVAITAWGFNLSAEQVAAIYLVAEAVLSLVNRSLVTPLVPPPSVDDMAEDLNPFDH